MAFNSFFGKRQIIRMMSRHPYAQHKGNKLLRRLFLLVGPIAVRLFGWPLDANARILARYIFSSFGSKISKGQRILDAGGAYGCHSFELAKRGYNVTIVDRDDDSLELSKTIKRCLKANVAFAKMDITKLGFANAAFDAVLMSQVVEHIKDDRKAVREMKRVLKPGGLLLVAVPYRDRPAEYSEPMVIRNGKLIPRATAEAHWRSGYNEKSITNLLHNNGFSIERMACYGCPSFPPNLPLLFPIVQPLSLLLPNRTRWGLFVKANRVKNIKED